jgi:hypothetical protein
MKYILGLKLGTGAFGSVYSATKEGRGIILLCFRDIILK